MEDRSLAAGRLGSSRSPQPESGDNQPEADRDGEPDVRPVGQRRGTPRRHVLARPRKQHDARLLRGRQLRVHRPYERLRARQQRPFFPRLRRRPLPGL